MSAKHESMPTLSKANIAALLDAEADAPSLEKNCTMLLDKIHCFLCFSVSIDDSRDSTYHNLENTLEHGVILLAEYADKLKKKKRP